MRGQVINAVHSNAVPCCAPAMEYVAMPDGSSSAAPVVNPGPKTEKNRRTIFDFPFRPTLFVIGESYERNA
jgi:hypothetical protein